MGGRKGGPPRTPTQIANDQKEIASRYLRGENQHVIAAALGLSQQMISYELGRLRKLWIESAVRDFDEHKGQELAKIDALEATYWTAWEESKKEHSSRTQVIRTGAGKDNRPEPQLLTVRTDEVVGDKKWLEGVQWCIQKRSEILGLNAPIKLTATTSPAATLNALPSQADRMGRLAAILGGANRFEGDIIDVSANAADDETASY